uniref:Uncharacterized protein n=1 Tax=Arundo donax TaxID=35708 RepID=A0A0A8YM27_ARUDO
MLCIASMPLLYKILLECYGYAVLFCYTPLK